jgi:hypothetical protein
MLKAGFWETWEMPVIETCVPIPFTATRLTGRNAAETRVRILRYDKGTARAGGAGKKQLRA